MNHHDRDESRQRRIEAALAAQLTMRDLDDAERASLHAQILARIERRVEAAAFGIDLLAAGQTVVAVDGTGRLVEHHPDGSVIVIDQP